MIEPVKKVALAKITLARGRTAKLGCLIPTIGETVVGVTDPTGFYVCMVPFSGPYLYSVKLF